MFADAQAYDRFMGRWSQLLAPLLVDFAHFPGGGQVLDVGSGTGALARAIADRKPGCRITGIDPSKEYVGYAQSRTNSDRLHFQAGDAQNMTFADGAFDHSLSLLVFNFIPDPFLLGQGPAGACVARLGQDRVARLAEEVKRRLAIASDRAPLVLQGRAWAVRGLVATGR